MNAPRPPKRALLLTAALLGLSQATCHQAILVAPPGSTLQLFANPTFIPAFGGRAVISALVIEPAGTPVPDGTVVQFFTSLGQIEEQGKTNDGVARVALTADSRSGLATVTAVSGGGAEQTASVEVGIGSALPRTILVTADPSRITESRSTHVTANVFDENGNPVANVPVIFTVEVSPSTEVMDSQGRPQFTDSNGRVSDVMRTRRQSNGTATVKVQAVTGSGTIEGTVDIPIVIF
ncbi:MAG: hypothetical protein NDJ94_13135 [Vicinamibacteria bacterium]|nr:hypothetical protein [Vicinamibacteria bacterium]